MAREESLNSLNRLTRPAPAKRIKPVQSARMQVCASCFECSRDPRFRLTVSQDVALLAECERPIVRILA